MSLGTSLHIHNSELISKPFQSFHFIPVLCQDLRSITNNMCSRKVQVRCHRRASL